MTRALVLPALFLLASITTATVVLIRWWRLSRKWKVEK